MGSVVASVDGWMDGERRGVLDICLGKAGDAGVWKDAKWCISQLVSGRGKEGTAKYQQRERGRKEIEGRQISVTKPDYISDDNFS